MLVLIILRIILRFAHEMMFITLPANHPAAKFDSYLKIELKYKRINFRFRYILLPTLIYLALFG